MTVVAPEILSTELTEADIRLMEDAALLKAILDLPVYEPSVLDNLSETAKRGLTMATAGVAVIAGSYFVAESMQDGSDTQAQVKQEAATALSQAPSLTNPPVSPESGRPMTRKEIIASYKSPLSKKVARYELSAGVMTVPTGATFIEIVDLAADKAELDEADLGQAVHEMNALPEDNAIAANSTLVLPGVEPDEVQAVTAEIIKKHLPAPEVVANPEVTVQSLMKQVLAHPNITIGPSDNDQVRKSMEYAAETGKTFAYNLGREAERNVDVSPRLLQMVLYLADKGHKITIDSMTTGNHVERSNHFNGTAIDFRPSDVEADREPSYYADPAIIAKFQPIYKDLYDARGLFETNEQIYAFPPEGTTGVRHGQSFVYFGDTRANHFGHIHDSTSARTPLPYESINHNFVLSPEKKAIIAALPIEQYKKDNLEQAVIYAMQVSEETGLPPALQVGQWATESGWGANCPGNNCFGMKVDGNWNGATQVIKTFEYVNGKKVYIDAAFKAYPSTPDKPGIQASFEDHAALIARAPHYADVVAAKDDWRAALHGLVNPGEPRYATAPNYEEYITDIITSNHIDQLTAKD